MHGENNRFYRHFAKEEEFLPTRLLDVGAQGSNDLPIFLVDTRSMAQLRDAERPLKYICLSYCWGAAQPPLKTTTGTIECYKAGIPIDSMPRVFRDAVLVTRTLGIRYLWIDALCIIQDCHGDWHNEAAAMTDVFSHSWMTIGAAAASSCHETLFHPRQDVSINIDFRSSIKRKIKGTISILLLSGAWDLPLEADLKNSTWNTRGWVLQEQKLPQKLLIFGEKMLHFKYYPFMFHEYYRDHDYCTKTELSPDIREDWTRVMRVYSPRKLSKGSDKLAAISGLVKAIRQDLEKEGGPATYIAGIWLAENAKVGEQLTWFIENPTFSFGQLLHYHSDPQQYIAPSWSWAALNEPVEISVFGGEKPLFRVVTHNIMPARSDPTVAIAPRSSITLFGKLAQIPGRPSMGTRVSISIKERDYTYWMACCNSFVGTRPSEEKGFVIYYYLDWNPCTQNITEVDTEACLQLFLLSSSEFHLSTAIGLILFPDVVEPRLFLRVGSFEILGPWESLDWKETEIVII